MELAEEDAQRLGVSHLEVAIKPASADPTYGTEYYRELIFYRLGRHLDVQALIPIVERDIAWQPLDTTLTRQLTEEQREEITVLEDEAGDRYLHGSVQLWVVGYTQRVGYLHNRFSTLVVLLRYLQSRSSVLNSADPLWASLSGSLPAVMLRSRSMCSCT